MNLLKIYMQGFNDSFDSVSKEGSYHTMIERRAYNLGWIDSIVGDDVSSVDMQTDEEIIERICGNNEKINR